MGHRSPYFESKHEDLLALFDQGYGPHVAARVCHMNLNSTQTLHRRWLIHGTIGVMNASGNKVYSFETRQQVVMEYLEGNMTRVELAKKYGLSSEMMVARWVRLYRQGGIDALKTGSKGRPRKKSDKPARLSDVERLEQENLYLRAQVAYLKN